MKIKDERGFTLVEILITLSIIVVLFVVLLPKVDFAGDKSRQAGVRTDFRTFQVSAETYLRENMGNTNTYAGLNLFLDASVQIKNIPPQTRQPRA